MFNLFKLICDFTAVAIALHLIYAYFTKYFINTFYSEIVKNKKVYLFNKNNESFILDEFEKKANKYNICGFDCEWPTNGKISLIQIGFPDGSSFLFQIFNSVQEIPLSIRNFIKDQRILKFGVGICEDSLKLLNDWEFIMRGCVDLRNLAVRLRQNGLAKMGLKNFSYSWLNISYDTLIDVQCSDWSLEELTIDQIEYASLDALVGVLCPIEFLHRKLNIDRMEAIEKLSDIRTYCQGCIDVKFKRIRQKPNSKSHKSKANYQVKAGPMYDNDILLTPDGEMLSRLSRKKANWYIKKGLVELVNEDPFTIRLKFEPSGRASGTNDYYIQEKINQCVVCGDSESGCVRKNVVPIEYRRHYPVSFKSHKSHDVLPLCVRCHQLSNIFDDKRKKEIAEQYKAPLGSRDSVLHHSNFEASKIRNAANALLHQNNIPEARQRELHRKIGEFINENVESENGEWIGISNEKLKEIFDKFGKSHYSNNGTTKVIRQHAYHGKQVVDSLSNPKGLVEFEVSWRKHFIDTLQPQYLPVGWEVDHRAERFLATAPGNEEDEMENGSEGNEEEEEDLEEY